MRFPSYSSILNKHISVSPTYGLQRRVGARLRRGAKLFPTLRIGLRVTPQDWQLRLENLLKILMAAEFYLYLPCADLETYVCLWM